ncbi:hypothetical protein E9232_005887 [Inquilinus ginsengisoli]|uniref:DUF262 domain-containing protein n=1 Tax=Inquilinus ginsengisoli TaxID=363840 RepID=A0ABU1JYI3_9PROT|nr:DUF262 domain-containing HNH endonuclease family protein [Inquilinus ginsengisoli]MDR6293337.1 hypothetical protein [Inquilinus ginsengisoli]
MRPDKLSIHDLFQRERRYTVPLYQRAYVWNEGEQWEPLWDDIQRQAEECLATDAGVPRRTHFLGAVVLNVQKIVGGSVARSEVIDGQQRLTTLQLFIGALRDFLATIQSTYTNKVRRLTINQDEPFGSESSFKVWPTNADRDLFRSVMMSGSPDSLLKQHGLIQKSELPRLIGAYCYFYHQIDAFVAKSGADQAAQDRQILGLFQALRSGLQLVVIELEDNDDPQIIFETLNARGQPLLPSDLIRNTIFHQASVDPTHASDEKYADGLYDRFWHPFDNDRLDTPINGEDRYWHVQERQGRLSRPRIDLFIFHFLVMQTGRELAIGHIFQEFRDWRDISAQPLESLLHELRRYSAIFRQLMSPTSDDRPSMFARRLRALDTSTVYPFLLYILGLPVDLLTKSDRDQIICDLESWFIRRLVCQLTNKNYNRFFVSLLSKVKQTTLSAPVALDDSETNNNLKTCTSQVIVNTVRDELLRSTEATARWPKDDEFEASWLEKDIYAKSRPDRAVMLLRAINAKMMDNKNETVILPDNLSVEHILPQQGALLDYPYPDESISIGADAPEIRRARIIHTIGNLTLLTVALNSAISNGPFIDKRPKIASNSALRLNTIFQDQDRNKWSEIDIFDRGRDLFTYAKIIWPHRGP